MPEPAAFVSPDDSPYYLKLKFEEGIGMENLRAFMVANSLQEEGLAFKYFPEDIETNPDTAEVIAHEGFLLAFKEKADAGKAVLLTREMGNISDFELIENEPQPAPEIHEETKASAKNEGKPAPSSHHLPRMHSRNRALSASTFPSWTH